MVIRFISNYQILEKIGEGGMGSVFLAVNRLEAGCLTAVKILKRDLADHACFKKRFLNEARILCDLKHPNICHIIESGETDSHGLYLVMAYYDGGSLRRRLEQHSLTLLEAFEIAVQIIQGLRFAADRGVVHRDVKPDNILFSSGGLVKIVDFGVSRDTSQTERLTSAGQFLGTLAYMSPEQLESRPASTSTDIWALGVVLHEMFTGSPPFQGTTNHRICQAILFENPMITQRQPPPPIRSLIHKALQKRPMDRYQSFAEVLEDLTTAYRELFCVGKEQASMCSNAETWLSHWRFRFFSNLSVNPNPPDF